MANFYIDNYGYQENILPKIHKQQGHTVSIVASTETYIENGRLGYVEANSYINEYGIPVTRLPYASWLPHKMMRKIRAYYGLEKVLNEFKPDIIFLHDVQFFDTRVVVKYVIANPGVKVYADGHTDFVNSARNWLSKNILHKIIYKHFAKTLEPYTEKFFGVTPLRIEFFNKVYGIKKNKLDLLVLGVDDSEIDLSNRIEIREKTRKQLGLSDNDFVIISGGKIDKRKNIHVLIDAFVTLKESLQFSSLKLVLFGSPSDEMKYLTEQITSREDIIYLGWLNPEDMSQYLLASDLACFPGTHSVLWEQSVGLGIPALFKRWHGMEHVDIGGNCIFLDNNGVDGLLQLLKEVIGNKDLYQTMLEVAQSRGIEEFSYFKIASKAIGIK